MKNFLFSILLLLVSTGYAQDTIPTKNKAKRSDKRHEFNIGFTNLFNRSISDIWLYYFYFEIWDDDFYPLFYDDYFMPSQYGAGYKYHISKGAIRTYFETGVRNIKTNEVDESIDYKETYDYLLNYSIYNVRLGYEFYIGSNNTQFFFGADLFGQYSNQKYKYERNRIYYYDSYMSNWYNNKWEIEYYGYGLGPFMGVRLYLNDMISVSTETRFDMILFNQKGSGKYSSNNNPAGTNEEMSSSGLKMNVRPLGLFSLNISF